VPTIERISDPSSSSVPELDVVFLHGIAGDPVKTWSYGSKESFWPRWLAEDNPDAAVWCVGFDASASRWRGSSMGILDRGINLLALLQTRGIGGRPLCLVGHSLGGLMAKQILFQSAVIAPDYRKLAAQARGVVFLGTPHDGASIARIAKNFGILRPTELLGNLVNDDPGLRQLGTWYRNWATPQGVRNLVFFEKRPMAGRLIVPESSADPGLAGVTPIGVDADHIRICKPAAREDLVYARVNMFVAGLVGRPAARGQAPRDAGLAAPRLPDDKAMRLEMYRSVFRGSGWSTTLRSLYPRFPLLEFAGAEFPIWAEVAAPTDRDRIDIVLGDLLDGEDPREDSYPARFDPAGAAVYRDKLAHIDETSSFNGATYALDRIEFDNGPRFKVHARHGTYFHSLATSELLEREMIDQLYADPHREVSLDRLPRRKWLHEVVGGERVVVDGRRRAAALSVAATLLMAEPDGTYSAVLATRSGRVETHQMFSHVAPAGIFAPINAERRNEEKEFSVRQCLMREYAEELFGYGDLEQGDGLLATDVSALPPIQALCRAEQEGIITLRYCGISVPLFTLRPEIYVLIFIKDPGWLNREIQRANSTDHWFELNWEYERVKDLDAVKLRLDPDMRPIHPAQVRPWLMVPHAAAALYLSTAVGRHLIRS
jgi:hypothetical protein